MSEQRFLQQNSYTRTYGAPSKDGVIPRFFEDAELDILASQGAGREIWKTVTKVEIIMPGNMYTRPVEVVNEGHKQRWPEAWKAFVDGQEEAIDGRPLEEWPLLNKAMLRELKFLGFRSVEDVANMTEVAIQRVGAGARHIKAAAQAFVEDIERVQPIRDIQTRSDRLESENAALKLQIEEQGRLIAQIQSHLLVNKDQPSEAQRYVPGDHDPLAKIAAGAAPGASSSLAALEKRAAKKGGAKKGAAPEEAMFTRPARDAAPLAPMVAEARPAAKRSTRSKKAA